MSPGCAAATRSAACLLLLPFIGTIAMGQEGSYYYDLNWHRTIKLGTAPFVNAELARRAKIAYSFDIDELADSVAGELYRDGRIVPAGLSDDGEYWVPAGSHDNLALAIQALERSHGEVVYIGEEVPSGSPGNTVVSWDPIPWQPVRDGERHGSPDHPSTTSGTNPR